MPYGEPPDFDTKLTPAEEMIFQQWKRKHAPNDTGADYDLRGAFKAGLRPAGKEAGPDAGHWPDTFKKPSHPTFSDESVYAKYGNPGHWEGNIFVPGRRPLEKAIADVFSQRIEEYGQSR